MAYRAKARSIAQAVTRADFWRSASEQNIDRFGFTYCMRRSASSEACNGTKINKRLTYIETAEFEEWKRIRGSVGHVRERVIAGRYEPEPTW